MTLYIGLLKIVLFYFFTNFPIFFVSIMVFSEETKVNPMFEITLTFVGISLFYLGILMNMPYYHQV